MTVTGMLALTWGCVLMSMESRAGLGISLISLEMCQCRHLSEKDPGTLEI